jgi:LacI family transcriptional regulator
VESFMKSTVQDIARRAGVSAGTVSNALTGKRPVAKATHQRILDAMNELGYQPNLMARGLVNQRSHVLSIVIKEFSDLGYYGYSSVLTGIQQKANQLGYSIMLHFVDGPSEEEIFSTLNQISAHRADGVIWVIHEIEGNRNWVRDIRPEKYPPIVFLHMHPDPALNVVSIDNEAGASMAVSHLIEQGCRKIGIITGPADWWESEARLTGWQKTLQLAGLNADSSLVVEGDWLAESGRTGMEMLLKQRPDIDAVFASNDRMALGVIHTTRQRGLSIPEDLLLVGYDNTPEVASYWPPLTSVRQGLQQSGQIAVEELHQRIETESSKQIAPRQHIIQPELIIRQSSKRDLLGK